MDYRREPVEIFDLTLADALSVFWGIKLEPKAIIAPVITVIATRPIISGLWKTLRRRAGGSVGCSAGSGADWFIGIAIYEYPFDHFVLFACAKHIGGLRNRSVM